jgi:hypothetical protein
VLVPVPVEAKSSLPGSFLASAINSATECAGTEGFTSTKFGLVAIRPIGAKSFFGS